MDQEAFGKILEIDLKNLSLTEKNIEKDVIRYLLGGPGFAIDYLLREKTYEVEPFSENNPLIFMSGLLTGTAYPCSGFLSVSARSPLTNIYGEGLTAGFFGSKLRRAFNGLIFKSIAENPVFLLIDEENYELRAASDLWGLDTKKTIQTLQDKLGKDFKIATIGPSGEKQIPMAAIINDHGRAVGRCGMGAVMGSKKLKAIAVRSSKKINYYDEPKFRELSKFIFQAFKKSPMAGIMRQIGTNGIDYFENIADVPHKNWVLGKWKGVSKISGSVVARKLLVKLSPCYLCPFSCGREVEVKEGPYKVTEAAGPEYETVAAFGSMNLNANIESITFLNDLCNRMGVDTISTGCTVAFAMECYEKGILTEAEVGFPLQWGDPDAIIKLTQLICSSEGVGQILSQGTRKAAELIGKDADKLTVEIKGLELPMHDPRANYALGLQYATANRGGCHLRGFGSDIYSGFAKFFKPFGISEEVPIKVRTNDEPNFAQHIAISQNLSEVNNALGICRQTFSSGSQILENNFDLLLDAIYFLTGLRFSLAELLEIGDRIFTLKRLFNTRCGISKKDDRIPSKLKLPLAEGLVANKSLAIDSMLEEYYKFRGWDEDGVPTELLLEKLKISDY